MGHTRQLWLTVPPYKRELVAFQKEEEEENGRLPKCQPKT